MSEKGIILNLESNSKDYHLDFFISDVFSSVTRKMKYLSNTIIQMHYKLFLETCAFEFNK